jgi:hypothetical protein
VPSIEPFVVFDFLNHQAFVQIDRTGGLTCWRLRFPLFIVLGFRTTISSAKVAVDLLQAAPKEKSAS